MKHETSETGATDSRAVAANGESQPLQSPSSPSWWRPVHLTSRDWLALALGVALATCAGVWTPLERLAFSGWAVGVTMCTVAAALATPSRPILVAVTTNAAYFTAMVAGMVVRYRGGHWATSPSLAEADLSHPYAPLILFCLLGLLWGVSVVPTVYVALGVHAARAWLTRRRDASDSGDSSDRSSGGAAPPSDAP